MPEGTVTVVVDYNDRSFRPLSSKGEHGMLADSVSGSAAQLPAVNGMTVKMPGGVQVVRPAHSTGDYASAGYLPPCSGGRGNTYEAEVKAVSAQGKVLGTTKMQFGRYSRVLICGRPLRGPARTGAAMRHTGSAQRPKG